MGCLCHGTDCRAARFRIPAKAAPERQLSTRRTKPSAYGGSIVELYQIQALAMQFRGCVSFVSAAAYKSSSSSSPGCHRQYSATGASKRLWTAALSCINTARCKFSCGALCVAACTHVLYACAWCACSFKMLVSRHGVNTNGSYTPELLELSGTGYSLS